MAIAPILWTVWSALVVLTAALYIYRSSLTKDEEDQIFLDDSFNHVKSPGSHCRQGQQNPAVTQGRTEPCGRSDGLCAGLLRRRYFQPVQVSCPLPVAGGLGGG